MNTLAQRRDPPTWSYWLIVRDNAYRGGRSPRILGFDLPGRGRLLPVFGSEEGAEGFVSRAPEADGDRGESGWHPRAVGAGELISLLSGSAYSAGACAGVERVVLDPAPDLISRTLPHGVSVGESRESFLGSLMGRGSRLGA